MKYILVITGIAIVATIFAILGVSRLMKKSSTLSGGEFVMLYQDSCPHCTTMKPLVKSASAESGQPVQYWEANEHLDFCRNNAIDRVPMLLRLGADGRIVDTYGGPQDKEGIKSFLTA